MYLPGTSAPTEWVSQSLVDIVFKSIFYLMNLASQQTSNYMAMQNFIYVTMDSNMLFMKLAVVIVMMTFKL